MLKTVAWYLLRHPVLTARALAHDPRDLWIRFYDDFTYARERRTLPCRYDDAVADWEQRLHEFLGAPWPCSANAEHQHIWPEIIGALSARGVCAGPESYFHWNDGDPALIRAVWCLVRHLKPQNVVETGVAHGVTSRFILEALKINGAGALWSIDLPYLQPKRQDEVGIAVAETLRKRWMLIRGSSRQRLPPLLAQLGTIDLFVHDSLHSERNVRFELEKAWAKLKPGGAIVVDDIDSNSAFRFFQQAFPDHFSLVCEAEPLHPDQRRFNQKGLFGLILKRTSAQPGSESRQ